MTYSSVFRLSVSGSSGAGCTFVLSQWGIQGNELIVSYDYPQDEVIRAYRIWQELYEHRIADQKYGRAARSEKEVAHSGHLPSEDWQTKLQVADNNLIKSFNNWLGKGALREMRDIIRNEANRLAQAVSRDGKQNKRQPHIEIIISCDSSELERLPWECWEITEAYTAIKNPDGSSTNSQKSSQTSISISRAPLNVQARSMSVTAQNIRKKRTQPRILVILTKAQDLKLSEDKKIISSILGKKKLAQIVYVEPQENEADSTFKGRVVKAIEDIRGWDVLIYGGHSDETDHEVGKLILSEGVSLLLNDSVFEKAIENGLQLAIFASCKGLHIAKSLIHLGLDQVLIMRELVNDRITHAFSEKLYESLAKHENIHQAVLAGYKYLVKEQYTFPSAYLLPSLFRYPSSEVNSFYIEKSAWKKFCKDYQLTNFQMITSSAALLLSFLVPYQDLALDIRGWTQAVYRDYTHQVPVTSPRENEGTFDVRNTSYREAQGIGFSPVILVSIDPESLNEAKQNPELKNLQSKPIDRRYLGKLVRQSSNLGFTAVGIYYQLDSEEPHQEDLYNSFKPRTFNQDTWFIFLVDASSQTTVFPKILPNLRLEGDSLSFLGMISLPTDISCSKSNKSFCPFAYLLTISKTLQQNPEVKKLRQSSIKNELDFQNNLTNFLESHPTQSSQWKLFKHQWWHNFGFRPILDLSIPPDDFAYQRISASEFLKKQGLQKHSENQVLLIASGGYDQNDADSDTYTNPLATDYWCSARRRIDQASNCRSVFTGGEYQAYMAYQFSIRRVPLMLHDAWVLILIVIPLGKVIALRLLKSSREFPVRLTGLSVAGVLMYGAIGLQVYVATPLALPWFLPSTLFLCYVLPVIWRKSYG